MLLHYDTYCTFPWEANKSATVHKITPILDLHFAIKLLDESAVWRRGPANGSIATEHIRDTAGRGLPRGQSQTRLTVSRVPAVVCDSAQGHMTTLSMWFYIINMFVFHILRGPVSAQSFSGVNPIWTGLQSGLGHFDATVSWSVADGWLCWR